MIDNRETRTSLTPHDDKSRNVKEWPYENYVIICAATKHLVERISHTVHNTT